jgi:glycosyltransferase involved in cell wall biosynthesis
MAVTPRVSLVIPGRNCSDTLRECLTAAIRILEQPGSALGEILFVDDGSTDGTRAVAAGFPIRVIEGAGLGAGAARNLGWRAASHELIWFVDADCVARSDALDELLPHLEDPAVAAVSGSYDNARPDSLLARLIHEEIQVRHARMGTDVDFLATFDVLYRRAVLEALDGFDERYRKGQDAELSFRVREAGHHLRFERASRVAHFHEDHLGAYLRTQRQQGYWRVFLHMEHRGHAGGDSYSRLSDHLQPPLAVVAAALLPVGFLTAWPVIAANVLLLALQLPLTAAVGRRAGWGLGLSFAGFGFVRAYARAWGMVAGGLGWLSARLGKG